MEPAAAQPAWTRHCLTALAAILLLLSVSMHIAASAATGMDGARNWQWPVGTKPKVLRTFDKPPEPWLSGHRGVDLEASGGDRVRAPADGRVVFAGWVVDRPVLTIEHRSGLRSSFEAVKTHLSEGDRVSAGDPVGRIAKPWHCSGTACLHWGVRRGGEYLNPLRFVSDLRPSVLLPVPQEPW